MAWGTLQRNVFDGACDAMIEDDGSGNYSFAEAANQLRQTLAGSTSNRGDGAYSLTLESGTLLRRWSASVADFPTKPASGPPTWAKLAIYGSTDPIAKADRNVGLWVELASGGTSDRRVNVHWLTGGVYSALTAWTDVDLPIVLDIEEQTFFEVGESNVHYHVYWTKTGSGGARTLLWDSGVRATPGYWGASRVALFQSGANGQSDISYLLTEILDDDYPTLDNFDPADRESSVDPTDNIQFNAADASSGINSAATNIAIKLGAGASWTDAVTGGVAQSGYSISTAAISGGYTYVLGHAAALPFVAEIGIRILVEDMAGNATEREVYFWTGAGALSTDLAERHGTRHLFGLVIDGLETILWEGDGDGGVPSIGWSRSGKACLRRPAEKSMELDLGDMKAGLSQITFDLTDIKDIDGTSYFGKLFAPARWDATAHSRVAEGTSYLDQIDANASTIPVKASAANLPASGTAYILTETTDYTGKSTGGTAANLTGVTKGKHSCTDLTDAGTWGYTYARPMPGEPGSLPSVGTVPFSWIGRRCALWVTTMDRRVGTWRTEAQAQNYGPLWVGRISQAIDFDPSTACWKLVATSIVDDLENTKIAANLPTANLSGINLSGCYSTSTKCAVFHVEETVYEGTPPVIGQTVGITPAHYTDQMALLGAIAESLNDRMAAFGASAYLHATIHVWPTNGKTTITAKVARTLAFPTGFVVKVVIKAGQPHAWRAMGFTESQYEIPLVEDDDGYYLGSIESEEFYVSYHPLNHQENGNKLYLDTPSKFWASQGDDSVAKGYCVIREAIVDAVEGTSGNQPVGYLTVESTHLTLDPQLWGSIGTAFAGQKYGEEKITVQQVYIPTYRQSGSSSIRGPYRMLLEMLSSTGTPGYNGAYDVLPLALAGKIEASLIDPSSFLAADAEILSSGLADRQCYIIDKPTSLMELICREAKLFGKPVIWARGKLRAVDVLLPPTYGDESEQLDDSNTYGPGEWFKISSSVNTVVNQYEVSGYNVNVATGKSTGRPIIIDDVDSSSSLGGKRVTIKHPGLWIPPPLDETNLRGLLEGALLNRPLRFPSQVLTRSLAPYMLGRVHVGEPVRFVSSQVYDVTGTGQKYVSIWAIPLRVAWNMTNMAGSVTMMLLSQYQAYGDPWSPGARAYDWDATNYRFTLYDWQWGVSGTRKDGFAFEAGDTIHVIERNAEDPGSPISLFATVAQDFEADGTGLLTVEPIDFAAWDSTRSWDVSFGERAAATTDQKTRGTWLADEDSEMLNSDTESAQRFG